MTPGRAGRFSDVLIDYYGFLLTATTITALIVLIWLTVFLVGKYKAKKIKEEPSDSIEKKKDDLEIEEYFDINIGPEEKKE